MTRQVNHTISSVTYNGTKTYKNAHLLRNANVSMTETHMIILTTFACHINTTKKNVNLLAVYFLKQMGNQTAIAQLETNHFIGILMAPVNIHQETILNQTQKSLNQTTVNMQNTAYTDN